ncbi:response regulator [Paraburkholderia pallida]|uniref:Response regulator n=1 Tax=Paraburkholderia pallida TaxID=2547399 RepID=A0A4P7D9I0_9BURK|nr:response regulator [Paraburkholderia pallida]
MIVSIVDDDENVRLATCNFLRSLGCDVRGYPSAEAFLDSGCLGDVGCVISDVQMSGMNGIEMQRKLKERNSPLPIIFISAFGSNTMRNEALENGALCFLDKPVNGGVLIAYLEKVSRNLL